MSLIIEDATHPGYAISGRHVGTCQTPGAAAILLYIWALAAPGTHTREIVTHRMLHQEKVFFCCRKMKIMGISTIKNNSAGMTGENLATDFLKSKGMEIVARNYRNTLGRQLGEIDIIAKDGDTMVFVEVKTLRLKTGGDNIPETNITYSKLQKLQKIAYSYLKSKGMLGCDYRFDAVSVLLGNDDDPYDIRHLPSIFI